MLTFVATLSLKELKKANHEKLFKSINIDMDVRLTCRPCPMTSMVRRTKFCPEGQTTSLPHTIALGVCDRFSRLTKSAEAFCTSRKPSSSDSAVKRMPLPLTSLLDCLVPELRKSWERNELNTLGKDRRPLSWLDRAGRIGIQPTMRPMSTSKSLY